MQRQILIETQEVWIVRRQRLVETWCRTCCEQVAHVTKEDAARLACVSLDAIQSCIEAGSLHFAKTLDGLLIICLNSLLDQR